MSDDSEPATVMDQPQLSHTRLLFGMALITVLGSLFAGLFVSARAGAGFFLGGVLALANYYWLKRSIRGMFDNPDGAVTARFLGLKYIVRYALLGGALVLIYFSRAVPMLAVILGMASFAFAVVLEGFIRIFSHSFKRDL